MFRTLTDFLSLFSLSSAALEELPPCPPAELEQLVQKFESYHPDQYRRDEKSRHIGQGKALFDQKAQEILNLKVFDFPAARNTVSSELPVVVSSRVSVKANANIFRYLPKFLGFYVSVVSVVDQVIIAEAEAYEIAGFSYITTPCHVLFGKEWFLVKRDKQSDQVEFELKSDSLADSWVSKIAYPCLRYFQRIFQLKILHSLDDRGNLR